MVKSVKPTLTSLPKEVLFDIIEPLDLVSIVNLIEATDGKLAHVFNYYTDLKPHRPRHVHCPALWKKEIPLSQIRESKAPTNGLINFIEVWNLDGLDLDTFYRVFGRAWHNVIYVNLREGAKEFCSLMNYSSTVKMVESYISPDARAQGFDWSGMNFGATRHMHFTI